MQNSPGSWRERLQANAGVITASSFAFLFAALVGYAIWSLLSRVAMDPEIAAGLMLTLTLTVISTGGLALELIKGEPPQIETHWGGFGGGGSGWRISPAMVYLVAMLGFGTLTTTLIRDLHVGNQRTTQSSKSAGAGSKAVADSSADSTARVTTR